MTARRTAGSRLRWGAAAICVVLLSATLAACVPGPGPTNPPNPVVGGSVNQVYVIKAPAGADVQLVDGERRDRRVRHDRLARRLPVPPRRRGSGIPSRDDVRGRDRRRPSPVTVTTPDDVPPAVALHGSDG